MQVSRHNMHQPAMPARRPSRPLLRDSARGRGGRFRGGFRGSFRGGAFSLIELLVVISIIAAVSAIAFPALNAMINQTSRSNAINAVGIGIAAARGYSDRNITFGRDLINPNPGPQQFADPGRYNGAAALFTPSNEIRVIQNVDDLGGPGGFPLERIEYEPDPTKTSGLTPGPFTYTFEAPGNESLPRHLNGFRDINVDYVTIPTDAGVAGILAPPSGSGRPQIIPPPFAVWFDADGLMVSGGLPYQRVYYDGNNNGEINFNRNRGNTTYTVGAFDPSLPEYKPANAFNTDTEKYNVPLDVIDTVIGVIVYDKDDMRGAGFWWDSNDDAGRWTWLQANGRFVMFSRQSGAVLRESTSQ